MENQQPGTPPGVSFDASRGEPNLPGATPPPLPGGYVPCPRCGSTAVKKVGFS